MAQDPILTPAPGSQNGASTAREREVTEPDSSTISSGLASAAAAAALAASEFVGRVDKIGADEVAVGAMRRVLSAMPISGVVVIGEGEKDEAPMLANGERLGRGGLALDIAVDPIEGTELVASGAPRALTVIAAAPRGSMFDPGPCFYMDKLIVGSAAVGTVSLDAPMSDTVKALSASYEIPISSVNVAVLNRPRNQDKIDAIVRAGARVWKVDNVDVGPAIMALLDDAGVHATVGIGGTPEGVATSAAVVALGGEIQARLAPQTPDEMSATREHFGNVETILGTGDLMNTERTWFAACGITGDAFFPAAGMQTEARVLSISTEFDPPFRWITFVPKERSEA